jgi:hypothetical protein
MILSRAKEVQKNDGRVIGPEAGYDGALETPRKRAREDKQ